MPHSSPPLEFLEKSQTDPKISSRVGAAVEKGGNVTMDEVMRIAHENGYSFTRSEFQEAIRRSLRERFAAGEKDLAAVIDQDQQFGSGCGECISWTRTWHPEL